MDAVVEFELLSGSLLLKWCNQQLKPLGKQLSQDALNEMCMMAGQELTRLSGELGKLAAYTGERSEITAADVATVVSPSPEYTVFMILDRLLEGKLAEATLAANAALLSIPNPVGLIAMFTRQLRIDTHMKLAMESGGNMPETLKALEVTEYRARYIQRQIRPIPAGKLRQAYQMCVDAEYGVKSGSLKDRAALDSLMIQLAGHFGRNQSGR